MPAFCLIMALVSGLVGSPGSPKEVYYQGDIVSGNMIPSFDRGYLVSYAGHDVRVFSPDGTPLYTAAARLPGGEPVYPKNGDVDEDGTLALALAYAKDRGAHGGGIALFDRAGTQIRFFDTGSYLPTQVAFGPDHSIWALGWNGKPGTETSADFRLLRNYSREGQEIGAYLPRSSFAAEPDPVGPITGLWQLRVSKDRVGALLYQSSVLTPFQHLRPRSLWVETDYQGKELGRWDVDPGFDQFAFTQSGRVYEKLGSEVKLLDRGANAWRSTAPRPEGILLGADADSLVLLRSAEHTLRWVAEPQ
jgi:hypothetical protein